MKLKPSLQEVLESLISERKDAETRSNRTVYYFPKPNNQTALNIYEMITGKTTKHFIWLKLDKEILNSWINALEVVCGGD